MPLDFVSIENFSSKIINIPDNLGSKIMPVINHSFNNWEEWIFIIFATVVSTIVALHVERKFRDKKRIDDWKLIKITFQETVGIIFAIFLVVAGFLIGFGLLALAIGLLKKISSTTALLVIILAILVLWNRKKKKKNRELASRFKKDKLVPKRLNTHNF